MPNLPEPQRGAFPEKAQEASERMGIGAPVLGSLPASFSHDDLAARADQLAPFGPGMEALSPAPRSSTAPPSPLEKLAPKQFTPTEVASNGDKYGENTSNAWGEKP